MELVIPTPLMPAFRHHTPDEIAQARTLYEETDLSPRDIARILGLGVNTFYRRVKRWGWRRRRLRVEEVDALALEAAASRDVELAAVGQRVLDDRRAAIDRAEAVVVGQLKALELMQERVALAALTVLDSEKTGRAVQNLAKALVEIARYRSEAQGPRRSASADQDDAELDEMRRRLARQLEALQATVEAEEAGEGVQGRGAFDAT
ncbi:hypothetical protein [Hansschlegelia plantiphila]|nr:hypothetical protein [Hansschlegelia plantiphila]